MALPGVGRGRLQRTNTYACLNVEFLIYAKENKNGAFLFPCDVRNEKLQNWLNASYNAASFRQSSCCCCVQTVKRAAHVGVSI